MPKSEMLFGWQIKICALLKFFYQKLIAANRSLTVSHTKAFDTEYLL